jgi:hypothetical protein
VSKTKKWQIEAKTNLHGTYFEGKNELVWTQKIVLKRRASDLENQESG